MKRPLSGYTLIEILIVMLIISIVTTVAVLTINFNSKKQIENLGAEISSLLSLAAQEAMLRPATLGLGFTETQYQFYLATKDQQHKTIWIPMTKPPLNLHRISKNIKITLKVNNQTMPLDGKPQITISSSGDFSPFVIVLAGKDGIPLYQVSQTSDGNIKSEPINEQ